MTKVLRVNIHAEIPLPVDAFDMADRIAEVQKLIHALDEYAGSLDGDCDYEAAIVTPKRRPEAQPGLSLDPPRKLAGAIADAGVQVVPPAPEHDEILPESAGLDIPEFLRRDRRGGV
jgi:hypothetical protein